MMHLMSGLVMGLLGSMHCIGMCGPIALALPIKDESKVSFFTGRLLYNLGRVFTYMIFGLVFGYLGEGLKIFTSQQALSVGFGVAILIYFIIPSKLKVKFSALPFVTGLKNIFTKFLGRMFRYRGNLGMFLVGIANGFLPCGFVYLGVGAAVALGSVYEAVIFMGLFGLGTIPSLLVVSSLPKLLKNRFNYRKLVPVFSVILAVLFILRGLNLGIPMISPEIKKEAPPSCCDEP